MLLLFFFLSPSHKLPIESYRHCAWSTDKVRKHTSFSTKGHLRLLAQWSSTFLKLHVPQLQWPSFAPLHRMAENSATLAYFLQINNQSDHFRAFPKWKIMTQCCPGAARANALNCGGVKYTHTSHRGEVKGTSGRVFAV